MLITTTESLITLTTANKRLQDYSQVLKVFDIDT